MRMDDSSATPPCAPMRVSVAMCTYNGERFLAEQLQSLLQQERLPDEVVVCDDGSTDRTVELIARFEREAPFPVLVVVNSINLGYSRNFQKAVALTKGDLIALADQDDRWYSHKLRRLVDAFADPAIEGVFSNGDLMDAASQLMAGDLWGRFQFDGNEQQRFLSGQAFEILLRHNVVTGMAFAFRSSVRDMLTWLPEAWPHDAWLGLMLAATGGLRACPEHLVAYRTHSNQQIGVPQTSADKQALLRADGLASYRSRSRERNLQAYRTDLASLEALVASSASTLIAPWREAISGKIQHSRRGMRQMNLPFWQRWPSVLSHWRDYRRYAPTGTKALLRDLVI